MVGESENSSDACAMRTVCECALVKETMNVWETEGRERIHEMEGGADGKRHREEHSPMPESKSGTMAASVMIRSWRLLRLFDQFCGSSGESVGCGHRTFVPSSVSLRRAATASPSSIFASLLGVAYYDEQ